jgi:membrane associated rhomboid family serine protease
MNYRYSTTSISFGGPLTPAIKQIILANVIVFVVQMIVGQPFNYYFSLTPILVWKKFYLWQLFSYLFLHGGVWHLVFNMLALFMFGCELERTWGARRFFQYYFLTGIGAGCCVFFFPGNYYIPTIGASGSIYGLLLAYGLLFPNRVIYLYMIIPLQAKVFVFIMGAIAFLSALSSGNSGISNIAHLGGMLFGFLYLKRQRHFRSPWGRIRQNYFEWKLKRARRKFQIYLNKKGRNDQNGPTIH